MIAFTVRTDNTDVRLSFDVMPRQAMAGVIRHGTTWYDDRGDPALRRHGWQWSGHTSLWRLFTTLTIERTKYVEAPR